MEGAEFHFRHSSGIDRFLESTDGKARDAVGILYADEPAKSGAEANPPLASVEFDRVPVLVLGSLVAMKLAAWRPRDQMHLTDLLDVGLIGPDVLERLPEPHRGCGREIIARQAEEPR